MTLQLSKGKCILMGDFNAVVKNPQNNQLDIMFWETSVKEVSHWLSSLDYVN